MIEVILRESVEQLGRPGEVVRVAPGYARNYLLPRGLAYPATPEHRRQVDIAQRAAQTRLARERSQATALQTRLLGAAIRIAAQAGDNQKLFGAVTAEAIAQAITAAGVPVTKRQIQLADPIHALGAYQVTVRLHPDVQCDVQITVEKAT